VGYRKPALVIVLIFGVGALVCLLGVLGGGSFDLSVGAVFSEILRGHVSDSAANSVIWDLRLPRVCTGYVVGGILGLTGGVFQLTMRNALAEPYVVGVSSGAAAGGAAAILLGIAGFAGGAGLLLASVAGGLGAMVLVLALVGRRRTQRDTLLLGGVVIGAMLSGLTTTALLAAGQDTNRVLRWLFGSLGEAQWWQVGLCAAVLVGEIVLFAPLSRQINALALGDDAAHSVGVSVRRISMITLVVGGIATSVTVGCFGIIAFVGLVSPHLARRVVGSNLVQANWASIGIGGMLLVLADFVAQRVSATTSMPVGAVTAILGAPVLLWLLRRDAS
jgi:iron complex transport system permease protein